MRRLDAAADCGALAAAPCMTHQPKARIRSLQMTDFGGGGIAAAIVDIDDLVIDKSVERSGDFGGQRGNIAGLVLDRDDDRKIHAFNAAGRSHWPAVPPKRAVGQT